MIIPFSKKQNILKNGISAICLRETFSSIELKMFDIKKLVKIVEQIQGRKYSDSIFVKVIDAILKYNVSISNNDCKNIDDKAYEMLEESIKITNRIETINAIVGKIERHMSRIKSKNQPSITIDSSSHLITYLLDKNSDIIVSYDNNKTTTKRTINKYMIYATDNISYPIFLHYYISFYYNFFTDEDTILYLYSAVNLYNESFIEMTIKQLVLSAVIKNKPINISDIKNIIENDSVKQDVVEIIGQDQQINEVEELLDVRSIVRLNKNKPEAVLMFVGPTGVGKTELAKRVALEYKDGKYTLIQMESFSLEHSVTNLFGSPLSYVGSDEAPPLLHDMEQDPKRVIIFDEIEKAHSRIYQSLIGLIDQGYATFNGTHVVSFKDTIIIFTSNVITKIDEVRNNIGFSVNQQSKTNNNIITSSILDKYFKPEFLGRIDRFILFNRISDKDTAIKIIKSKLNGVQMKFGPDDCEIIYENSKEMMKKFGVRAINNEIEKYIAQKIRKQNKGDKHGTGKN